MISNHTPLGDNDDCVCPPLDYLLILKCRMFALSGKLITKI